jgi:hypothetical protein
MNAKKEGTPAKLGRQPNWDANSGRDAESIKGHKREIMTMRLPVEIARK